MSVVATCLAIAIFYESKGEPIKGQQAVAEVILNRSKHPSYPKDPCDVIKQKGQFSWYNKNISLNKPPSLIYKNAQYEKHWETAKKVAAQSLNNKTNHTKGSVFFNTRALGVRFKTNTTPCIIGRHIFY